MGARAIHPPNLAILLRQVQQFWREWVQLPPRGEGETKGYHWDKQAALEARAEKQAAKKAAKERAAEVVESGADKQVHWGCLAASRNARGGHKRARVQVGDHCSEG